MSYTIFYWIHIVSYIAWLLAFAGSLYFAWKVGKAHQTSMEYKFIRLERKSTSLGAHLGALGILVSGGAMASVPSGPEWGWFNFELHAWLGIKQAAFILIIILVAFSIRQSITLKKRLRSEEQELISEKSRQEWKKAYNVSMMIYSLVVFNTLLGWFKPF